MKFGNEFKSQMVQEWQEAYMNYNNLKTILKEISALNHTPSPMAVNSKGKPKRRRSLYRAFSGLTSRHNKNNIINNDEDENDDVILVSAVDDQQVSKTNYQTMVFMSSNDQNRYNEQLFFKKLDFEFNKVVMFYRGKVDHVLKEAEELNKQMDVLIALRIKVDDPALVPNSISSSSVLSSVPSHDGRSTGNVSLSSIQEVEMTIREPRPAAASAQVLIFNHHVKIDVHPESSPVISESHLCFFSKKGLKIAEDLMAKAFVEFYQRLRILKTYRSKYKRERQYHDS